MSRVSAFSLSVALVAFCGITQAEQAQAGWCPPPCHVTYCAPTCHISHCPPSCVTHCPPTCHVTHHCCPPVCHVCPPCHHVCKPCCPPCHHVCKPCCPPGCSGCSICCPPSSGCCNHVVKKITKITIEKVGSTLKVCATGEVNSGGWTHVRLLRVAHCCPPADGFQEYYLVACPPNGPSTDAIEPVTGCDEWKNYKHCAPWLKGVRIRGIDGGIKTKKID